MADTDDDIPGFVTLDGYSVPTAKAAGLFRTTWLRIRDNLGLKRPDANVFEDLRPLDVELLDKLVPMPRHGSLYRRLDSAIGRWLTDETQSQKTQIIVYPPTDDGRFLKGWAEKHHLDIIVSPNRSSLQKGIPSALEAVTRQGLVIIPDLQQYFLREIGGLEVVKTLLLAVSNSSYPAILGCNSWAWQFLIKAVNAHHLLPTALVPQAYTASQINSWFKRLSRECGLPVHSLKSGGDIFAGSDPSPEIKQITFRSRGVPWVAWDLWRRSLHARESADSDIVWVSLQPERSLVDTDEKACLLILQSLLIHGRISAEYLARTVPRFDISTHVSMLERQGWISEIDGQLRVRGDAYPRVRNALASANYPTDGL